MQRSERTGLGILVASLGVMAIIAYMFLFDQVQTRMDQVRGQGVALARVLGGMSWQELVPSSATGGVLRALRHSHSRDNFAYVAVVSPDGKPVALEAAPGVIVPNANPPADPSAWLGEREVPAARGGDPLIEFHAPVISDGNLVGYVRLGYLKPGIGIDGTTVSSVAQVALVVFLLVPVFFFLLRRETSSLKKVSERLDQVISEGPLSSVEVKPSEEMNDFIARFSQFVDLAKDRIQSLENEHSNMETSNKLLAFRQGKIEAILRTLPEAVMVLDEAGVISYANDRLAAMLDLGETKLAGRKPMEFCTNQELLKYLSPLGNSRRIGFVTDAIQFSPSGRDDELIEVRVYPLFSPRNEQEQLGTLVVFRDIAEEQASKQGQGEFVAQVSHELKTPLNVLSMYSESLLGEDGQDEAYRVEAINVIHDEVERLSGMINSMLALTRLELGGVTLERGRVRLVELLQDAFENVSQSGRARNLEFHLDLPREISPVNVDKEMLRIAVNNLLTNAIKYNRPAGKVILQASETDEAVEIRVSDTGFGISEQDRTRIFEKFYRSENEAVREQQGHGLGLPLAMQIVRLHHGNLSVQSVLGEGTSFVIHLPKDAANVVQAACA